MHDVRNLFYVVIKKVSNIFLVIADYGKDLLLFYDTDANNSLVDVSCFLFSLLGTLQCAWLCVRRHSQNSDTKKGMHNLKWLAERVFIGKMGSTPSCRLCQLS